MPPVITPGVSLLSHAFDRSSVELKRDGVVEGLMVPWDTPTDVADVINGQIVEYREEFARGAFWRASKAPNRAGLAFTHSELMPDRMGYGLEFHDSAEGAVGVWKLYNYAREMAEELLTTTHRGLSVTFTPMRSVGTEAPGRRVIRTDVNLAYTAATDRPAYADARVLAMRERDEILAAELEQQEAKIRERVELLQYLHRNGRELTPAQAAYLAEQGVTLAPAP